MGCCTRTGDVQSLVVFVAFVNMVAPLLSLVVLVHLYSLSFFHYSDYFHCLVFSPSLLWL